MPRTILVIGGGAAGLAAAIRLANQRYTVTLLEARSELGGRLIVGDEQNGTGAPREVGTNSPGGLGSDTLPTVILGHHTETQSFVELLGTAPLVQFPNRLVFAFLLPGGRTVTLRRPWLPGPLRTLVSTVLFRALPFPDRWRALNVMEQAWEGDPPWPRDLETRTAEDWLVAIGQTEKARAQVWTPFARFLTGDDIDVVSAAVLVDSVKRCFLTSRHHSKISIPPEGMAGLLVRPAGTRLQQVGATVRLNAKVTQITFAADHVTGVHLANGAVMAADQYVVALPHGRLRQLIPERLLALYSYFQQLTLLEDTPAVHVQVSMDGPVPDRQLLLLARRTFHWIISYPRVSAGGRSCLVSLVAVGRPELLHRTDQELYELALSELAYAYPRLTTRRPLSCRITREPTAFLSSRPGTHALRPLQQSPIRNLFLAGDWTDTGLPATLESAIASGHRSADALIAAAGSQQ